MTIEKGINMVKNHNESRKAKLFKVIINTQRENR